MQSEIDDIRQELRGMAHLNVEGLLDQQTVDGFINRIGDRLGLIELQQADRVVRVPVLTLAIISQRARQEHPRRFTVIEGEKA
jgi:hypothetical protein